MRNVSFINNDNDVDYEDDAYEDTSSIDETTCRGRLKNWQETHCSVEGVIQAICISLLVTILWLIFYSIFGDKAGPYSDFFCLLVLFGSAKAFGILIGLMKIPPIMGMIAMGILLKNIGYIHLSEEYLVITAFLRKLTLLSILLPAAFSLDPMYIKQKSFAIIVLAIIPSLVEAFAMCFLAYYLLNLAFLWSLLCGFIISAAAPAIIIPCLFDLEKQGYGNVNGIHTLITASCILGVVWSVTLFGLVFGILTSAPDEVTKNLLKGPLEILIGVCYGVVLGLIAQYVPHNDDWYVTTLRTTFIAGGSLLSLFGSYAIGYGGAGVLGCFCFAFVANIRWRKLGWWRHNPVRENYKLVWTFLEPVSFSLIGMEITIKELDLFDALYGLAAICISTSFHIAASVATTKIFKYSNKHSLFIAFTWIAKATVQAALGPIALDYAREANNPVAHHSAKAVLTVTVISIVLTAPIGTIILLKLGPKLLDKYEAPPIEQLRKSRLVLITEPDHAFRRETRRRSSNVMG